MAIVRWEPVRDFAALQQDVNRVFSSFFDPATQEGSAARWIPPVDLEELEDAYLLVADLPGVPEDDVAIDVEGDVLTLSGARTRQAHEGGRTIRSERGAGSFRRQLTLPDGVDADRITATYDRGVLRIRVPKPAAAKPRRVSIQVGETPATIEGHGEAAARADAAPAAEPAGTAA
jgi:HSP20 family protein